MDKTTPNICKKPSSLRYYQEGLPDVDIDDFFLKVTGKVGNPLTLSFQEIMNMKSIYFHRRTVCVCLWSIKRHWEGILLRDILELAGVDISDGSLYIKQVSIGTEKGVYDSTIHLKTAIERNALIAYKVDNQFLPVENGFPLRLIDFGLYLYKCVKGLSELQITSINELGYWEKLAGYSIDGTILPKKYFAVDLEKKFFFDGRGEIKDSDIF